MYANKVNLPEPVDILIDEQSTFFIFSANQEALSSSHHCDQIDNKRCQT
jgi:hypothetical protein